MSKAENLIQENFHDAKWNVDGEKSNAGLATTPQLAHLPTIGFVHRQLGLQNVQWFTKINLAKKLLGSYTACVIFIFTAIIAK